MSLVISSNFLFRTEAISFSLSEDFFLMYFIWQSNLMFRRSVFSILISSFSFSSACTRSASFSSKISFSCRSFFSRKILFSWHFCSRSATSLFSFPSTSLISKIQVINWKPLNRVSRWKERKPKHSLGMHIL